MTNFCAITTKKDLELMDENAINFILTRQLEQPEFQEYLSKTDKPWILDCDSFEIMQEKGKYEPTDFDNTLALAKKYHPTYMILPDYICNAEKTFEAAEMYIDKVKEIGVNPVGAIQAKNEKEICNLTFRLWDLGVRCFAIPLGAPEFEIESMRNSRIERYKMFKAALNQLETEDDKIQYLHFLGMCQNINELFLTPPEVNSLDSGKPIQFGRALKSISDTYTIRNDIHFAGELDLKLDDKQLEFAKKNIEFARWAIGSKRVNNVDYRDWTVSDLAPWKDENRLEAGLLGLVEEIGEFSSPINKSLRKTGKAENASYEKLRGELSDIVFYLNLVMHELNITYEELVNYNYAKLNQRYQEGYSAEAAEAQVDKKIVKE